MAYAAAVAFTNLKPTQPECGYIWEHASPSCNDGDPINGYWWIDENWVPGLPTIESWFTPAPIWSWGNAVFYGPNVMEGTAKARGFDLTGYLDGVAMPSCADVGLEVWLKPFVIYRDGEPVEARWEGPYLVVDCAQRSDIYGVVVHRGEVVEVGFETARRWGMADYGGSRYVVEHWKLPLVQVSKVHPVYLPEDVFYPGWHSPDELVHLPSWWKEVVRFSDRRGQRPLYRYPSTWRINGEWITYEQPRLPDRYQLGYSIAGYVRIH